MREQMPQKMQHDKPQKSWGKPGGKPLTSVLKLAVALSKRSTGQQKLPQKPKSAQSAGPRHCTESEKAECRNESQSSKKKLPKKERQDCLRRAERA